jgi:putative peptidoglycan lipid II flippase
MDAFNVATRIPTLLRELFAEGAMSAAFVPTFTKTLAGGDRARAWRLGSLVFNTLLIVTGAIVAVGIVFAHPITAAYAGEYAAWPSPVPGYADKFELTVALTRITMPFLAVIALAAVVMGMLNAVGRFFIPAFAPATFNIVLTLSAVASAWLGPLAGIQPLVGLSWGFVLGGLAQLLVQWPALRAEGYRHAWAFDARDAGLRQVLGLMGPGTMGQAASQINLWVNTWLATGLGTGAVSWLTNAFRLMYLPIGIFGVSVATATLPDLARHAQRGAHGDMRATLSWGLRLMLMLNVPATFGLIALSAPIVELIFEGGRFTSTDTQAVAAALICYAPGLLGYSAVKIVSPAFYALGDATTPMRVSFVSVGANLVLNLTLVRVMGYQGLALGTAIAALANAVLLLALIRGRIGGIDARRIGLAFLKITMAALVMAVAAFSAERALHGLLPDPWWLTRLVRVAGGILAGLMVLGAMVALLRIQEFGAAMQGVLRRVRRPG